MAKGNEGLIPMLKDLLGPVNIQFKKDLEGYKISELYGVFVGLIFLMSFAIGILSAYSMNSPSNGLIPFGIVVAAWGLIGGVVLFFLFAYIFVHIYTACFKRTDALKATLLWQVVALIISILLTFVTASSNYIYGGFAIFFILLFIYPSVWALTTQPTESANIKNTLHRTYLAVTIIIYIIQFVIQFAHL
ncbi:MAG: hypothetical protein KGI00_03230 [Candidatus Micrarchaeota archaeon]|nr:hypothetical protein [Candidatus Micrarchaeota archaeon]MDE1849718.1 hypothetical protein [Candidatus Micrarchaeota archaeon]